LNIVDAVVRELGHTDGNDTVVKFVHPLNIFWNDVIVEGQLVIVIDLNDIHPLKVPDNAVDVKPVGKSVGIFNTLKALHPLNISCIVVIVFGNVFGKSILSILLHPINIFCVVVIAPHGEFKPITLLNEGAFANICKPLPVIPLIIGGKVTDCNNDGYKLLPSPNAALKLVKLLVPNTAHNIGDDEDQFDIVDGVCGLYP
jgi:hypothetical protein